MLTLLEAAKLVQDPLKRGVIEIFPRTSPVLERLPFFNVNGQAYKYNIEETLPGIAFRGINESYTEDTGVVLEYVLQNNQTYYWRLNPNFDDGREGGWSEGSASV